MALQCSVAKCTLAGTVRCPPSKSYTHRAVFMASLAESGGTTITNILRSADTDATIRACKSLGAKINASEGGPDGATSSVIVADTIHTSRRVIGTDEGHDHNDDDNNNNDNDNDNDHDDDTGGKCNCNDNDDNNISAVKNQITINAENSGTTIRIAAGVAALLEKTTILTGDKSLTKRPMQPLLDALFALGARCTESDSGHPPLTVQGPITGGSITIPGDISSQFLTSLFLCAPKTKVGIEISITGDMVSKPYLDATIRTMREFGVSVQTHIPYKRYRIEPQRVKSMPVFAVPSDASSLAILLAASTLSGGRISIEAHMGMLPQGDEVFIEMLESMGASVQIADQYVTDDEDGAPGRPRCEQGEIIRMAADKCDMLRGGRFDLGNHPDLLPPLAITALKCDGPIEIFNVQHARLKETDRIAILARELPKLGITVDERKDGMVLCASDSGTSNSVGATQADSVNQVHLDSGNDHRLFMSLCIGAMHVGSYTVSDPESVRVSYPRFIEDMKSLGAALNISQHT